MTTTRHRNFTVNASPLLPTLGVDLGVGVGPGTGLAPTYTAIRLLDGWFWNAVGGAWQAGAVANAMTEFNAASAPGFYTDATGGIPVANLALAAGDEISIAYYIGGPTLYSEFEHVTLLNHIWNELETAFVTPGAFTGTFGELMVEIASLGFRFQREFNHTYNAAGQLTGCSIRVYATQADAIANVNPIRTLTWATSYAANRPNVSTCT